MAYDAVLQEKQDQEAAKNSPLWPKAVEFLSTAFAPELKEQIRDAIKADPENWIAPYHFFWGMSTRNALRKNGFGEDAWPVQNLDNIYVPLVEAAVED